ncbi:MAG: high-potential iron-sulfur protein, partial [Woeseiaceae bacterium]|nr:high-potential iron-sulfur protein [Woeseiaceae bacterium]
RNALSGRDRTSRTKETPLSKIARRKFIQLSAAAAAGCFVADSREAVAQDLPKLSEDDPMAQAMKYTHDASTVDPASRANPAEVQNCANCALVQGNDGDEWRPCQIFPGKAVAAAGWCSVWAPKA